MESLVSETSSGRKSRKWLIASISALLLLGLATYSYSSSSHSPSTDIYNLELSEFKLFQSSFSKAYDESEHPLRFKNFRENSAFIRKVNSLNKNFKLALNKFADMSREEFASIYLQAKAPNLSNLQAQKVHQIFDSSKDWVALGHVTSVKNQGSCGSCYSFSALGAIESAFSINTNQVLDLSEQQIVDCSFAYGNEGCNGGWMHWVFDYVMAHGVATEAVYPYQAETQRCKWLKTWNQATKISGYGFVEENDFNALASAIYNAPVAVAVDASTWHFYSSGVLDSDHCGTELNHGVLAVGYDMNAGTFTIKNSWGSDWGENGFIHITMTPGEGTCGVQSYGVYPII